MDVALCTITNSVYDIATFEALGEPCISTLRRHLLCPRCLGPGFYRKAAPNGRAASFGARAHQPYCDVDGAVRQADQTDVLAPGEKVAGNERIHVDFDYGIRLPRPWAANAETCPQANQRRLNTLLRNLMFNPGFDRSEQLVSVETGVFTVRELFMPFARADVDEQGRMRGYWGLVSDAAQSGDQPPCLWLNSGGRNDLSVVVDSGVTDDFVQRFPVQELEDLAGAYMLVFGCLRRSRNDKKYIAVSDISRITLDKLA